MDSTSNILHMTPWKLANAEAAHYEGLQNINSHSNYLPYPPLSPLSARNFTPDFVMHTPDVVQVLHSIMTEGAWAWNQAYRAW